MSQKPLLLKEFLELDPFISDDESSTTVRYLLESEHYGKGSRLIRYRSKGALITKISNVINNAVKNFLLSSPTTPSGSSKKLSRRFWKKKEEEVSCKKVTVKDIVRLNSFESSGFSNGKSSRYFPSPVVSSCSEQADSLFSGGSTPRSKIDSNVDGQHQRQPEEVESQGCCNSEEEKEQLSPISVMDFPYQEDEEGDDDETNEATFSSFEQNLANIERTTHQLLEKIRRFESLAELDPVNLDHSFASFEENEDNESTDHVASSDEDQTDDISAWDLIRRLKSVRQVGPHRCVENLLVDFFMEGLSWSRSTQNSSAEVDGLISAACDWMDGGGCLDEKEHCKDQVNGMERNGRWRSFEEGRDDVAADVEVNVLGSLLHELVLDLLY